MRSSASRCQLTVSGRLYFLPCRVKRSGGLRSLFTLDACPRNLVTRLRKGEIFRETIKNNEPVHEDAQLRRRKRLYNISPVAFEH